MRTLKMLFLSVMAQVFDILTIHKLLPLARRGAQFYPDSKLTKIMNTLVVVAALLVSGAVARSGGYAGVNIPQSMFFDSVMV